MRVKKWMVHGSCTQAEKHEVIIVNIQLMRTAMQFLSFPLQLLYPLRIKPNFESEGEPVTTDKDITIVISMEAEESSTPLIKKALL